MIRTYQVVCLTLIIARMFQVVNTLTHISFRDRAQLKLNTLYIVTLRCLQIFVYVLIVIIFNIHLHLLLFLFILTHYIPLIPQYPNISVMLTPHYPNTPIPSSFHHLPSLNLVLLGIHTHKVIPKL